MYASIYICSAPGRGLVEDEPVDAADEALACRQLMVDGLRYVDEQVIAEFRPQGLRLVRYLDEQVIAGFRPQGLRLMVDGFRRTSRCLVEDEAVDPADEALACRKT